MLNQPIQISFSLDHCFFLPNAFIREFVAIILMHKKRHIVFTVLLLILIAAIIVINVKFVG